MNNNLIRLQDAGFREREFAFTIWGERKLPGDMPFAWVLEHGMYDTSTDEIILTVKAVAYKWKVNRP